MPAQPMPRQYGPVIGQERATSYTYTTAARRAAAASTAAAARDSAEDAEDLESEAEEANEGSSKLQKLGIGLLVVGGIYIVAKKAGKGAKKPAGKKPAFGG
jgi:tartrate dehydratase alpha subunit/fumarate hydratase class I-like protein